MNRLGRWWFGKTGNEVHQMDNYDTVNVGNVIVPEKLSHENAFSLANSVAELYFPIDFYADRISKLRFFIANKSGKELVNTELNRFVSDNINPLYTFSDLIYFYAFSLLSDGNTFNYLGVPSIYQNITPSTIERWDVLQPNMTVIDELSNISSLNISSWNEAIRKVYYNDGSYKSELEVKNLEVHNYGIKRRSNSNVLSSSPLWNANKSIDTLLSVYSARYNVYANNGMAGILSRKQSSSGNTLDSALSNMDGSKRDEIIADINQRHGLTGRRNIWGISGYPLEFVKTLATIKELMPLEETLENAIKIASVYQIPPNLVPRKDQSKYDNQDVAEATVWENGLLSQARTVAANLTKLFRIDKTGNQILFDVSSVSALMENKQENEDLIGTQLDNLKKLKELNPETSIEEIVTEIQNRYGNEQKK